MLTLDRIYQASYALRTVIRRTDLIRFGRYAGSTDYNWEFKGGISTGVQIPHFRTLFPIPESDLGVNPQDDGKVIRLIFPPLTEEKRKVLAKDVSKLGEDAKVAVRSIRRDCMEKLKKKKKDSEITEDDLHDGEDKIQKITDKFIKRIDEMVDAKEKDIMEI